MTLTVARMPAKVVPGIEGAKYARILSVSLIT